MSRLHHLLDQIPDLDLLEGNWAIFGSGPLAVRGLRDPRDLDVIVTEELWSQLTKRYNAHLHENGLSRIQVGDIEILSGWHPPLSKSVSQLIEEAELIEGIPYVRLDQVLEWKRLRASDKDIVDISLIEAHK
ncbi:MAG: hypothetical protein ABR548_10390 [Actinomycetota bacterium]|nr:hypothetical protein [Actinomycetota bacterium]